MSKLLSYLDGYHTILAGLGLLGLAVYQALGQSDWSAAAHSFLLGATALGLRRAVGKVETAVAGVTETVDMLTYEDVEDVADPDAEID